MPPMFERSDQRDNAHPVVERFLLVNVPEAARSEMRAALDASAHPWIDFLPGNLDVSNAYCPRRCCDLR